MAEQTAQLPTSSAPWDTGCPSENDIAELGQGLVEPALRVQLIAHLDRCSSCTALLAELAEVVTPEAPRRIGRYEVLRRIGAGGMGVVYLAVDSELKRRVAIKLIRADLLDGGPAIRSRLVREAQLLAALTHPNVVAVYDVGEVDGDVFVAMEYVEGLALADWLREHAPDWATILPVFEQAGQGLAAAHALDIVHRDVKPSNLLVGVDGRVRLTDFGLATIHREATSGSAQTDASEAQETAGELAQPLTQAGAIVGTPAYMAPEQRAGRAGPLADQFSFCLCLYEALTLERPVLRGDRWESAPSRSALDAAPAGIRNVVNRGLSPDPTHRFESMTELLESTSWTMDRSTDAPSLQRAAATPRGLALVVAALIIAGALIAGALLMRSSADTPARRRAAAHATEAPTAGVVGDARAADPAETQHPPAAREPGSSGRAAVSAGPPPSRAPSGMVAPRKRRSQSGSWVSPEGRRKRSRSAVSMGAVETPPSRPRAVRPVAIPPLMRPLPVASREQRRQASALVNQAYRHQKSGKGQACLKAITRACKLDPRGCHRWQAIQALCEITAGRCKQGLARLAAVKRKTIQLRYIEQRAGRLCPTGGGPRVRLWRLLRQVRDAVRGSKASACQRHGKALLGLVPRLSATLRSRLSFTIHTRIMQAACCLGKAGRCAPGWRLRFSAAQRFLGKLSPSTVQKLQGRFYRCATRCKPR